MIRDPDGAYSQLVSLQEGAKKAENINTSSANKAHTSFFDVDKIMKNSGSRRFSLERSISKGSSAGSSRRSSFTINYALPGGPITVLENDERVEDFVKKEIDVGKRQKVSMKRLAYLNKPEIPVLLVGSVAAAIQGVLFPIFGLLLSSAISMFFKPPSQLKKDSRFWALIYLALGCIALVAVPVQNYFFGIAGGKLIERIRSLTFEKVVHQQISWFDNPANSRCVKQKLYYVQLICRVNILPVGPHSWSHCVISWS